MGLQCLAYFKGKVVSLCKVDVPVRNGQCSGLVRYQDIHLAQAFQSRGILNEYLLLGGFSDTHHESRRGRQPHGTGTGGDQHRHSRHDSLRKESVSSDNPPRQECDKGNTCYDWDKYQSRLVDNPLHGSF